MFEGQHVRLRAYTKDDIPKARDYLNDPDVGMRLRPGIFFPFRLEDEEAWYNNLNATSEKEYSFAVELKEEKTYIGGCGVMGIDPKNHVAMVGIFLGKPHCGNGYGTDAMRLLVNFCFQEINLHKVKLNVYSFNKRAIRSYEKVGFQTEGVLREEIFRFGRYHDEIIMGLLRSEWTPLSLSEKIEL